MGTRSLSSSGSRRGSALIMALVFLVIASSIVVAGTLSMKTNRVNAETWFRLHGQAQAFAKAGLTESMAWFRRQSSQPVISFAPQLDTSANPPILDTNEPALGLVREFEISGTLYGRYEVPLTEVLDISEHRGLIAGCGGVWKLHSKGYVYRQNDSSKAFNEAPNTILARTTLETEIRRFTLTPPAQSAICGPDGGSISIVGGNSLVDGGTFPGVTYLRGTGTHKVNGGGTLNGGAQLIPAAATDPIPAVEDVFGYEAIFGGLSMDDLRSMADIIVTDVKDFPQPMPANSIVFADCDLIFTNTKPLHCITGAGILIINGRLTINNGANPCYFNGFIYAADNVAINAVSVINGSLVTKGKFTITGNSDTAEVHYDESVISSMLSEIGQYRISRATTNPHSKE